MKLESITIKKLFGTFNYRIDLNNAANPLIITGLNGYGKTTLLTIIDRAAHLDFLYFYSLPFEEIKLDLEGNTTLNIISSKEKEIEDDDSDSNLDVSKVVTFDLKVAQDAHSSLTLNKKTIKQSLRHMGYYYRERYEDYDIESRSFYESVKDSEHFYQYFQNNQESQLFFMLLDGFKSEFIQAQRIIKENPKQSPKGNKEYVQEIEHVSENLRKILREINFVYLQEAQQVDSRLIDNLLSSDDSLSEEDYDKLKSQVQSNLDELKGFGLVNETQIKPYDKAHAQILTVYLKSLKEKLQKYDNILPKLKIFSKQIANLSFVNKAVTCNPRNGLEVRADNGKSLDAKVLSSGEQNEIIMLFNMIFEVKDSSVLMIDEPEISLHVAWQNDFIKNLREIAESKNLQVIVATHSPQIIGSNWEEAFDMTENNDL